MSICIGSISVGKSDTAGSSLVYMEIAVAFFFNCHDGWELVKCLVAPLIIWRFESANEMTTTSSSGLAGTLAFECFGFFLRLYLFPYFAPFIETMGGEL